MIPRWLALICGLVPIAGCVSPYQATYPSYPMPLYVQPPPYAASPAPPPVYETPLPAPVPLLPTPEPTPQPMPPEPDPPVTVLEPAPESETPAVPPPEVVAPPAPPAGRADPGADTPLQGFRPMHGQTRPGI